MAAPDLNTYGGALQVAGFEGGVVNMSESIIVTGINDLALPIDFGRVVSRSLNDGTCKAVVADAEFRIGISVRTSTVSPSTAGVFNYPQYALVPIMKLGFIYVIAFENTARGDGAISVTAQNGRIGSTTGGAAGAGRMALTGCTWETATAAGQLGIVAVRMQT